MPTRVSKSFAPKGNKFGAVRVRYGDETFDSQREARRWAELLLLQRDGHISDLERQVSYDLTVCGVRLGKIKPDFRYQRAGQTVVEEVKSEPTKTRLWLWKRKHLRAEHGVELKVVQ